MNDCELRSIPTFFDTPFGDLIDLNNETIAICGLFCDHYGGGNPGSRMAPRQIRYSNWPETKKVNSKKFSKQIFDIGDLNVFPLEKNRNIDILKEQCIKILQTGTSLVTVGGDYSNTPAMVSGVIEHFSNLSIGVIRVSRRLDTINENAGNVCSTRCKTSKKIINLIGQENSPLALIGTSGTISPEEVGFLSKTESITAKNINNNLEEAFSKDFYEWAKNFDGFYLSVDADVLLPGLLDTTLKSRYTGLTLETLYKTIEKVSNLNILAADFTGYVPEIDLKGREETIRAEKILECIIKALCVGEKNESKR